MRKQVHPDSIIVAAEELLREGGPAAVHVNEAARRAGSAAGSIYNHFGSKAGLLAAVALRSLERHGVDDPSGWLVAEPHMVGALVSLVARASDGRRTSREDDVPRDIAEPLCVALAADPAAWRRVLGELLGDEIEASLALNGRRGEEQTDACV